MHFVDAIEALADTCGMEVPRDEHARQEQQSNKPLYSLLENVTEFYRRHLREHQPAIDYLKDRGLDGETAKRYAIGYAPDGWDALNNAFSSDIDGLLKTGMLKTREQDVAGQAIRSTQQRAYQRFRNRIMFPIRDRRGRVIAFGGRVLSNEEPKYLNSPETPLFHKGQELYGLFEARKAMQDAGHVVVVEGYMDVVALAQHGVNNAVATLGTAANQQHSEILFRIVPNIVFCFDGDRAGRAAAWRALTATLPCLADGRDAHFLFLPDGEDPDSVVQTHGGAGFRDLLDKRVPIIDFLYEHLASDLDISSIGGKAQLADKAKPLVNTIPKSIYRQLALRRLETLIGLPLGSEKAGAHTARPKVPALPDTGMSHMRRAVMLLLQVPSVVTAEQSLPVDPTQKGAEVLNNLLELCRADTSMTTARLLERFRDTPHYGYLTKLATKPYWPDHRELDQTTAIADFAHAMAALHNKSSRTAANKLDPNLRKGLLSRHRS